MTYQSDLLSDKDFEAQRKGGALIGNMGMFLTILVLGILSCMWLFSDISGEYYMRGQGTSVRMSLIRQATSLWGELTFGPGAVLELVTTELPKDEFINLTFETPQKLQRQGVPPRVVAFSGTIKEGVIVGEFIDGKRRLKAKLERSGINSVYRQIESHLPWQLYDKWFNNAE
ncbi:MAG: hypothetical protein SGJ27_16190 [Candidatus Melainabacteria bacterium]|nr:hypothetical protein [Candidatus Melainabacteria bacterium]